MGNKQFLNAIERVAQPTPPIWMMRQAGRYHHHYQNLRKQHTFMELCKIPELAAEVAMGPIEEFDFDVAILFSDLLFPLEALGMGLEYTDKGPKIGWSLGIDSIKKIRSLDDALPALQFQKAAVAATRERLPESKSLIGFVGGPWTLFAYAVAGSHKGSLQSVKQALPIYAEFCETMIPLLRKNIELQFAGGAELVMIFDTAAGELSPLNFEQLVVPGLEQLTQSFPGKIGYYAKQVQPVHYRSEFFQKDILAGYGVDHRWDLQEAIQTRSTGFIQGNFDESMLCCEPRHFQAELNQYLDRVEKIEDRSGWVCGLGHGILPQAKEENVRHFVRIVRERFK